MVWCEGEVGEVGGVVCNNWKYVNPAIYSHLCICMYFNFPNYGISLCY